MMINPHLLNSKNLKTQDEEETGSEETDEQVEVKTMEALEDALKDLVDNRGLENVYVEIPHGPE